MRRNLDAAGVGSARLQLLDLAAELPVQFQHAVDLALLPIHHVAQFLQRTLQVRDLELQRLDANRVVHDSSCLLAYSNGAAMLAMPSSRRADTGLSRHSLRTTGKESRS
mgnify:CR=1 FL=1